MSWIDVKDRLPENQCRVIVNDREYGVQTGWYSYDGKWVVSYAIRRKENVTHWMPLPKPPQTIKP